MNDSIATAAVVVPVDALICPRCDGEKFVINGEKCYACKGKGYFTKWSALEHLAEFHYSGRHPNAKRLSCLEQQDALEHYVVRMLTVNEVVDRAPEMVPVFERAVLAVSKEPKKPSAELPEDIDLLRAKAAWFDKVTIDLQHVKDEAIHKQRAVGVSSALILEMRTI